VFLTYFECLRVITPSSGRGKSSCSITELYTRTSFGQSPFNLDR
jgi:hypothetical protein